MTTLWIDDDRELPSFYDHREATVDGAIRFLEAAKERGEVLDVISFDYDAHAYLDWTFTPVADWMRDNDFWPKEVRVHTFNYWKGRPWYEEFFYVFAPESTVVDMTDPWNYADDRNQLDLSEAPEWVQLFVKEGVKVQS
jgi:hypothetical protein